MCSLSEFWREMGLDETVHPRDQDILNRERHSFRTNEPPPAFIGDIERAPVIVLLANGGWNGQTSTEFQHAGNSPRDYVARLHSSAMCDPKVVAPYYGRSNLASYLAHGHVALLNLIPYRSPELSKEPENVKFAGKLPSSLHAIRWINEVAMPQASVGRRLVILKRGIWLDFLEPRWHSQYVDTQRRGPHVYLETRAEIDKFVAERHKVSNSVSFPC
jgi:hypothetical protein